MQLTYTIRPRAIAIILLSIAVYLALQSLLSEYLVEEVIGDTSEHILVAILDLFSVNLEDSIPTWYSTFLLLAASILLSLVAAATENNRPYWVGLTAIFFYLSLDEGAAIHEILTDPLRETFNSSGYLYFAWQIAAIPIVIIIGLLYLRFLWKLPAHIRNLFILGGFIYLAGVLGFEAISANQWYQAGEATFRYLTIATIEEFCEMLGVIIFIFSLLIYITERQYGFLFATPAALAVSPLKISARQVMILLAVIIGINGLFITAATRLDPPASPPAAVTSLPAYQGIIQHFPPETTLAIYTTEAFNITQPTTFPVVAALLPNYASVGVIAFPTYGTSIILASDTLIFDQNMLTELLHSYNETSFILYDPALVRSIVRSAP